MKAMRKQYGKKEGESVFYASKNKGTIKGVDEDMDINEGEVKRRNKKLKNKRPRANFPEGQASDDVTPARNPQGTSDDGPGEDRGVKKVRGAKPQKIKLATIVSRTKSPEGKRARAKETMKRNLMAHTVYHDMGYLMAESLGLVSEARDLDRARDAGADKSAPSPKKKADRYDSKKELRGELAAKARGQGKTADDVLMSEPAKPRTPEQEAARKKFQAKQKKSVATAKLKHRARTTGEPQKVIKRKKK